MRKKIISFASITGSVLILSNVCFAEISKTDIESALLPGSTIAQDTTHENDFYILGQNETLEIASIASQTKTEKKSDTSETQENKYIKEVVSNQKDNTKPVIETHHAKDVTTTKVKTLPETHHAVSHKKTNQKILAPMKVTQTPIHKTPTHKLAAISHEKMPKHKQIVNHKKVVSQTIIKHPANKHHAEQIHAALKHSMASKNKIAIKNTMKHQSTLSSKQTLNEDKIMILKVKFIDA